MTIDRSRPDAIDPQRKREILARLLRERASAPGEAFELSSGQEALWFLNELAPQSAAYNVAFCGRLRSSVDHKRLETTILRLLDRHPMLRATFRMSADGPRQRIGRVPDRCLELLNASGWNEEKLTAQLQESYRYPFDLTNGPVFRASLFSRHEMEHILLLTAHHIVFDAWSLGIILSELTTLYNGGEVAGLPPASYADFVRWQRNKVHSEEGHEAWRYWHSRLEGLLTSADLPTDRTRPGVQSFQGATHYFDLAAPLYARLRAFTRAENATLFIGLVAALNALLHRYTGSPEIATGTLLAGRTNQRFDTTVGYFVNPVVLRARVEPETSFRQLVAQLREVVIGAQQYGDFPFPELVKRLQPVRDTSRTPLFHVMLNLIKAEQVGVTGDLAHLEGGAPQLLGPLSLEVFPLNQQEGQFDLDLTMIDTGAGIRVALKYRTDLFETDTIERMAEHFTELLSAAIANPDCRIEALPLLSGRERLHVLAKSEGPRSEYPRDTCVHQLFERQASATPDAIAVVCGREQIAYRELDRRANRLANYLRSLGIGPEALVGLCLDRSVDLIVAVLGVLKAGGAYLPLDPQYPQNRLAFMLEDSGAALLITEQQQLAQLPSVTAVVCLDRDRAEIARQSSAAPLSGVVPNNLAYVIYTSGSTGKPKGVLITHSSVVNFLASMGSEPGICRNDRMIAVTTLSFDIAGLEIYLPLSFGARVILATRSAAADAASLARLIEKCRPTIMQATPATWRMLVESGWAGLAGLKILCGGEALSRELANRLLSMGVEVWNLYGPTETTIWSTIHKVDHRQGPVPIGRPIANTYCYLLDAALQLVPNGTPGELYIGGDGLARGYLNRAQLTAAKFVTSPFDSEKRLYRTGDLARYMRDGNIEFLGRLDNQVKLRGFRIELSEIEAVLEQQPGVRQAVALVREDVSGDQRVVAYVTAREPLYLKTGQLRKALAAQLPDYMVPSVFVVLESLPLTANRKIDVRALPAPDYRSNVPDGYVAPHTPTELSVAALWKDLLKIEDVGVSDNFFDLGGHSLLVAQLQSRLRQQFGKELPLAELLAQPTVRAIAELLDRELCPTPTEARHWKCLVPIQPRGTLPPLFVVVGFRADISDETTLILSRIAAHLDPEQPVYGLRPRWVHGCAEGYRNVEEMAHECLAEIQSVQTDGPYLLGGYCFAGSVALEIAQQLVRAGEDVKLLALVDTFRPNPVHAFLINVIDMRNYLWNRGRHVAQVLADIAVSTNGSRRQLVSTVIARKLLALRPKSVGGIAAERSRGLFKQHWRLLLRYRAEPYLGHINLFVNETWYHGIVGGAWYFLEKYMGWPAIAKGGLTIHKIPGDHQDLLTVQSKYLAGVLRKSIDEALAGSCRGAEHVGVSAS